MTAVAGTDPRTGMALAPVGSDTAGADVDRACAYALAAAGVLDGRGRGFRAGLLRAMADGLEARRDDVLALADRETALGERLAVELARTCYQLRFFAEVCQDGGYLEVTIDHAGPTPMGPRPDLRRMLVPIGPVAVFGAGNFPLAFSVPGGDTASALAAGCPVVVKAHPSHPATSVLCFEILQDAAGSVGAPEGTLGLVHGQAAGTRLVAHPAIRAVGFTGSLAGGRALMRVVNERPDPIPFYGELSSLNPLVVTAAAVAERAAEIASGLVSSVTGGAGQLCTKPGYVFVPAGEDGDRLVAAVAGALRDTGPLVLLNKAIYTSYGETTQRLCALPQMRVAGSGVPVDAGAGNGGGYAVTPLVLAVRAGELDASMVEECFGPATVIVRYAGEDELLRGLDVLPSALAASLHLGRDDVDVAARLVPVLRAKAGRLVFNGYPTGVAVSWAQHHGGPWPSTNSLHTSVGATAIRRFLRPVTWQDAPLATLPAELREDGPAIPRRVDGRLVVPGSGPEVVSTS